MTSIRESVRRWIGGLRRGEAGDARQPDPEFAYTLYWTKRAREWDHARRHRVRAAVEAIIETEGFLPNDYRRIYSAPEVDESAHAGASLLALRAVLDALEREQEDVSN